ncbi:phosphonate ABC transporter, permease protein PhnE [Sphingomonas sp. GlSt437]|uniref:phosphonate ABC transporter, permease protein PhnE n=1 Tax=Sphingomonas sp. GlSt437 TaxID=3389970 RepID=UPI003A87F82A
MTSLAVPAPQAIAQARLIAGAAVTPAPVRRLLRWLAWGLSLAALLAMAGDIGLTPKLLVAGFWRSGHLIALMWPPTANGQATAIFVALGQTLAMAFLGTAIVVVAAFPLGLLGARSVVAQPVFHFVLRLFFDLGRAIPVLVWAIILVAAFGLGPRVGVAAMVLAEIPYLAKIFAETMENRRKGVIESVQSAGGSRLQVLRYGLLPQVLPLAVGQAMLLFESNLRESAALGLVGAGGIGVLLVTRIQLLQLDQVAWILVLFMIMVMTIDLLSQMVRRRLIEAMPQRAVSMADA